MQEVQDSRVKYNELVLYNGTYLNKGGAAIAYGTLKVLRDLGIDLKYIVDPDTFPIDFFNEFNIHPIYRFSDTLCRNNISNLSLFNTYKPFIRCLKNSYSPEIRRLRPSHIWHIGDSPFSDHRSKLSVIGQVVALESLKISLNGMLIIGGISLEYPRTKTGESVLKHFFNHVDHIFIRGSETQRNLNRLGVVNEKMTPICDFAYHIEKVDNLDLVDFFRSTIEHPDKPTVALILRDYSHRQSNKKYIIQLKKLIYELEKEYWLIFVPTTYSFFIPENDLFFTQNSLGIESNRIINIKDFTPNDIINLFTCFDFIISTRLHGAVIGTLANIPTIHLYEGRKALEVLGSVFGDQVPLIKLSDFTEGNKVENILAIIKNSICEKKKIAANLKCCINAEKNASMEIIKYKLDELL